MPEHKRVDGRHAKLQPAHSCVRWIECCDFRARPWSGSAVREFCVPARSPYNVVPALRLSNSSLVLLSHAWLDTWRRRHGPRYAGRSSASAEVRGAIAQSAERVLGARMTVRGAPGGTR
jgi:hypothetical protein